MSNQDELEALYSGQTDPWDYEKDPYELGKYAHTLASLPQQQYETGLEIGCSVGVFTRKAATRVTRLLGVDLSATAVQRARERCTDLTGVSFRQLNFVRDDLDERFDVIFCSEVLYYIPPWRRTGVARRIASWLKPGGDLVLVHTWQHSTREWDDIYGEGGAESLHRLFTHVIGLPVIMEESTGDYAITIARAAPPETSPWLRQGERIRLGVLAVVPTARMIVRKRLLRRPSVQRTLARLGRGQAPESGSSEVDE